MEGGMYDMPHGEAGKSSNEQVISDRCIVIIIYTLVSYTAARAPRLTPQKRRAPGMPHIDFRTVQFRTP